MVCIDLLDGVGDDGGRVDGDDAFHAGREGLLEFSEDGAALLVDVERVGVGELLNADADGFAAVSSAACEFEVGVVVFGADLGAAYIFEQDDCRCRGGAVLDDDVLELRWIGEPADDADGHLVVLLGVGGLLAELAGGDFDVLLGEGVGDVEGGKAAGGETGWDRARCAWRTCARRR